jgi:hypothetical protein
MQKSSWSLITVNGYLHLSDDPDVEVDTEINVGSSSPAAGQNARQQSPLQSGKIDAAKLERTTKEVQVENEIRALSPTGVRQDDDAERSRRRRREVNALEADQSTNDYLLERLTTFLATLKKHQRNSQTPVTSSSKTRWMVQETYWTGHWQLQRTRNCNFGINLRSIECW